MSPFPRPILAIDPGTNGGFAYGFEKRTPCIYSMPETEREIVDLLKEFLNGADGSPTVFMENLPMYIPRITKKANDGGETTTSIPSSSAAVLFRNDGLIRGTLYSNLPPNEEPVFVTPQAWQKLAGAGNVGPRSQAQWKNHLKGMAQTLYPELKVTLATADALLIWHTMTYKFSSRKP